MEIDSNDSNQEDSSYDNSDWDGYVSDDYVQDTFALNSQLTHEAIGYNKACLHKDSATIAEVPGLHVEGKLCTVTQHRLVFLVHNLFIVNLNAILFSFSQSCLFVCILHEMNLVARFLVVQQYRGNFFSTPGEA